MILVGSGGIWWDLVGSGGIWWDLGGIWWNHLIPRQPPNFHVWQSIGGSLWNQRKSIVEESRGEYRVVFKHHRGRFVCGLAHLRKYRARRTQIIVIFEKSAVAFLAGLPMGFAWYIKVWAPVGPPGGQRSDISTPHAHGMGLWAGGALAWGGPPRTAGPGASPAKRPIRGSPTAPNHAGAPRLGPKPGLARGQAARARLVSPPPPTHRQYR